METVSLTSVETFRRGLWPCEPTGMFRTKWRQGDGPPSCRDQSVCYPDVWRTDMACALLLPLQRKFNKDVLQERDDSYQREPLVLKR